MRPITKEEGAARRKIATKYLEVAEIAATEDGAAINVAVGIAVLAGIAASDAICAATLGERYAGQDHSAAVQVLKRVDDALAQKLKRLGRYVAGEPLRGCTVEFTGSSTRD